MVGSRRVRGEDVREKEVGTTDEVTELMDGGDMSMLSITSNSGSLPCPRLSPAWMGNMGDFLPKVAKSVLEDPLVVV